MHPNPGVKCEPVPLNLSAMEIPLALEVELKVLDDISGENSLAHRGVAWSWLFGVWGLSWLWCSVVLIGEVGDWEEEGIGRWK